MKEIIKTPFEGELLLMVPKGSDLSTQPAVMALRAKSKKLFVEYDEETKLIKQLVDLDAMGLSHVETVGEYESIMGYRPYQEGESLSVGNSKLGKKPCPEYVFRGKFYANELELAEALVKAEKLKKLSDVSVYDLCWELAESLDMSFTFNDLSFVCEGLETMLGEYDQRDLADFAEEHGFSKFSYEDGKHISLDGNLIEWEEAEKTLVSHGIFTIESPLALWSVNGEEWYKDLEYSIKYLMFQDELDTFKFWVEHQPEGIYEKLCEEYDIP